MSHFLERLIYLSRRREAFADGHGELRDEDRMWEEGYRQRWQHDNPSLSPSQRSEDYVQPTATHATLPFLMVCALEESKDVTSLLKSRLTNQLGAAFPGSAILDPLEGKKEPKKTLQQVAALPFFLSLRAAIRAKVTTARRERAPAQQSASIARSA